jgi:serine protease AprX
MIGGDIMFRKTDWETKLSYLLKEPGFSRRRNTLHRLIVEFSDGKRTDRVSAIVGANKGKIHHELRLIPSLVVEVPFSTLEELARSQHVKKIWHDARVFALLDIAVPAVGGSKVQEMGFTGKDVTIAVIDTGIHPHRDLTTPNNRILSWNDLVNQRTSPYDDNGHGTHVAGIIAGNGRASNGKYKGMAPDARLVGVKVLDRNGSGMTSTVLAGIEWCIDHLSELNIKVLNLSMGSTAQESYRLDPLCRAVSSAWAKGIVVCTAAGNEGPQGRTIDTPGINPQTITVGNVDDRQTLTSNDDQLNQTSSRGPTIDNIPKPDILAPGTEITSLWINGGYRSLTGTSMSTPMVTGAVAQMFQKWPDLKPNQIKNMLMRNARSINLGSNLQGAGEINMERIFQVSAPKTGFKTGQLQQIFSCHLMQNLMEQAGQDSALFKKKRDELIQAALVDILSVQAK